MFPSRHLFAFAALTCLWLAVSCGGSGDDTSTGEDGQTANADVPGLVRDVSGASDATENDSLADAVGHDAAVPDVVRPDLGIGDEDLREFDPCTGRGPVEPDELDLSGDGACDATMFWDVNCATLPPDDFALRCGQEDCDREGGVCEAMQPCGAVRCTTIGGIAFDVARPCPYDPDCLGAQDGPPLPCIHDGYCDTWCPNVRFTDRSIDPDCDGQPGAYCPGGPEADQCE